MAKPKKNARADSSTASNVGYEARLWQMADALRGSMDAAEHKHVCFGPNGRLTTACSLRGAEARRP